MAAAPPARSLGRWFGFVQNLIEFPMPRDHKRDSKGAMRAPTQGGPTESRGNRLSGNLRRPPTNTGSTSPGLTESGEIKWSRPSKPVRGITPATLAHG